VAGDSQLSRRVRFGAFELDLLEGELRRQGLKVKLNEKPFQVLSLLIERAGHLVRREELRQHLWPADTYVDFDSNMNTALSTLRHALGDSSEHPIFIETVPRQGYRFIASVMPIDEVTPAKSPEVESTIEQGGVQLQPDLKVALVSRRLLTVLAATVILAVVVAIAYFRWQARGTAGTNATGKVTILVTPFENLSGDPSQEYLSDGLTDEMITRLGQSAPERLSVIARSTAMQYKGIHKPVEQIAREQHVDYILEGSLRRQDDRVRITARLFSARQNGSLWAQAYERYASDLLVIQRDVAERIAQSLSIQLLPSVPRSYAAVKQVNPQAYDDYLKGLFYLNKRTEEDLRRSIDYFHQASEKDPQFAPAFAALGLSYNVSAGWTYLSPKEAYPNAKAAGEKALGLDDSLADAHFVTGEVEHEYDWDWAASEAEYKRGLALNPSSAAGHKLYAEYLTHAGRFPEAIAESRKAQQLDPISLITSSFVCFVYYHAREFDKAIQECSKVLDLDPDFVPARFWRGASYMFSRRYPEALSDFKRDSDLSSHAVYFESATAMAYALQGNREQARSILERLKHRAEQGYVSPFLLADIYICLDDKEQALAMLQKAEQEHSADLIFLATAPEFESLAKDSRYQEIVARIGFPKTALEFAASQELPMSQ
jgi:TolB-like protein/DNA-binding winged helix-turn-helix (wHTH) protein